MVGIHSRERRSDALAAVFAELTGATTNDPSVRARERMMELHPELTSHAEVISACRESPKLQGVFTRLRKRFESG